MWAGLRSRVRPVPAPQWRGRRGPVPPPHGPSRTEEGPRVIGAGLGEGAEPADADHDPCPADCCLGRHADTPVLAGVLRVLLELALDPEVRFEPAHQPAEREADRGAVVVQRPLQPLGIVEFTQEGQQLRLAHRHLPILPSGGWEQGGGRTQRHDPNDTAKCRGLLDLLSRGRRPCTTSLVETNGACHQRRNQRPRAPLEAEAGDVRSGPRPRGRVSLFRCIGPLCYGSAHFWLGPVWQAHRWIGVPSFQTPPDASRHLPDCGLRTVPSAWGCQVWAALPLQP